MKPGMKRFLTKLADLMDEYGVEIQAPCADSIDLEMLVGGFFIGEEFYQSIDSLDIRSRLNEKD